MGLVYPEFRDCVIDEWSVGRAFQPGQAAGPDSNVRPTGRLVGGIDFGWGNPFAALHGVLDHDDVLWIGWERYLRETPSPTSAPSSASSPLTATTTPSLPFATS
jgi:hypothetical protein